MKLTEVFFEQHLPEEVGGKASRSVFVAPAFDLTLDADVITCKRNDAVVWQVSASKARYWVPSLAERALQAVAGVAQDVMEAIGETKLGNAEVKAETLLAARPTEQVKPWVPQSKKRR